MPQGSVLGPIIFKIFMNDLFYFIVNSDLHNYADDNTISAYSNTIKNLIKTLEKESEIALSWLNNNKMIANPNKFHSILLSRAKIDTSKLEINIGDRVIQSERSVKLLGVTIDDKLNFNLHISNLCRKASAQLNALFRFKNVLSLQTRSILAQSFVYANFNYCPLVWHFSSSKSLLKIEKLHNRALSFIHDDKTS